jgi:hypothetical protein
MTEKHPYSYTVLRYVHDVTTAEFVNVGLVLHSPTARVLRAETRRTIGRIRDVFPDFNRSAFLAAMKAVKASLNLAAGRLVDSSFLDKEGDAATFAWGALPVDDSSLQWSPIGTGLTADLEKTFARLYERFVTRYDTRDVHRRTDEDVWRPVRDRLIERNVSVHLGAKEIAGATDIIAFSRAWKNGAWHAYEPLSMDLADADGIKDKARLWLGHLAAVADGPSEPFKVYFLVGAPQDRTLLPAFETAKAILSKAPFAPSIYDETQIDDLVSGIEDEFRAHQTSQTNNRI